MAESHKIKQLFTYGLHKIDCTVVILCEKSLLDSPHRPWLEHLAWRTLSDTHRALYNERHYLLITTCSGWRDSAYTYPISQGVLATGIASKSHDMFYFFKAVGWCHSSSQTQLHSLKAWIFFKYLTFFLGLSRFSLILLISSLSTFAIWQQCLLGFVHTLLSFQLYGAFAIKCFM